MPERAATPRLRRAVAGDAELLFGWLNEPDCLDQKRLTSAPVPWVDHLAWMERRLADPGTGIWIAEQEGRPIGQLRLQRGESGLEVDIYVAREHRGKGFAAWMLHQAGELGGELGSDLPLVAVVKETNGASLRLFEKSGFKRVDRGDGFVVYHYQH